MTTLTDKGIIAKMHEFNLNADDMAFSIAVQTDDGIELHERENQLSTHYKDINKPGDLNDPFPKGKPIGIGISLREGYDQDVLSFLLGKDSPYKKSFGETGLEFTMYGNEIGGFVLTDTKIDPTPFVHMLINLRSGSLPKNLLDAGIPEKITYLIPIHIPNNTITQYDFGDPYHFTRRTDYKRWWNADPIDMTTDKCKNGKKNTFYERAAYNRTQNNEIWAGENAVPLVKLLKEKGLTGKLSISTIKHDVVPLIEERINA
jgi:hypothetical protein